MDYFEEHKGERCEGFVISVTKPLRQTIKIYFYFSCLDNRVEGPQKSSVWFLTQAIDADVLNLTHHDPVMGRALTFTRRLTSTGIPMVQNSKSYNLKNPTENYTPFPGQNVTLVLYHPPINADLPFVRKRQERKKKKEKKKARELILASEMC